MSCCARVRLHSSMCLHARVCVCSLLLVVLLTALMCSPGDVPSIPSFLCFRRLGGCACICDLSRASDLCLAVFLTTLMLLAGDGLSFQGFLSSICLGSSECLHDKPTVVCALRCHHTRQCLWEGPSVRATSGRDVCKCVQPPSSSFMFSIVHNLFVLVSEPERTP